MHPTLQLSLVALSLMSMLPVRAALALPASDAGAAAQPTSDAMAAAQPAPAPGFTPTIKIGGRLYGQFGVQTTESGPLSPTSGTGFAAFDITRSSLILDGRPTDWLSLYMILDTARQTEILQTEPELKTRPGRLWAYLRTANAEIRHLWDPSARIRFGLTTGPWSSWEERLWGYRMLGQGLVAREKIVPSEELGIAVLGDLPQEWGSYHVGVFSGESGSLPELDGHLTANGRLSLTPFGFWAPLKPLGLAGFSLLSPEKTSGGGLLYYKTPTSPLTLAGGLYAMNDTVKGQLSQGFNAFGVLELGWLHPGLRPFELLARVEGWRPDASKSGNAYTQLVTGIAWALDANNKLVIDNQIQFHEDPGKGIWHTVFTHYAVEF